MRLRAPAWFVWVPASYFLAASAFSWPLPAHLGTRLTGSPAGDTGVYVWNLWVFSHELLENHAMPLFTSTIFSLDHQANLSLHNYTVFSDLLSIPLLPIFGIVASFNLIYLASSAMAAFGMFLLARHVCGRTTEAWLAGLLFGWAPALVARGTAHFSLVAAAPLPIFMWLLLRAGEDPGWRDAAALGATAAWASLCDPYYGIYCAMLALFHLAASTIRAHRTLATDHPRSRFALRAIDALLVMTSGLIAYIAISGGTVIIMFGVAISLRGLHTPVLVLTVLLGTRLWLVFRPAFRVSVPVHIRKLVRVTPIGIAVGGVLLSPVLFAMAVRVSEGRWVTPTILWRSSPPGVDLLAYFMPNPNNPLFRSYFFDWLVRRPGGFEENVAAVTFVALGAIAWVAWKDRSTPSRYWVGMVSVCALMAMGPFIRVATTSTYLWTPWTLLRFVPVIGGARSPARMTVLVMMGVAVLFALSLKRLCELYPSRRRALLTVLAVGLAAELLPAPRLLHSAEPPSFYSRIAQDPRRVRVLELPFGIRDGLSDDGDFTAASQFYQTFHHKRLIGGYLSRVSPQRFQALRNQKTRHALVQLSEGGELSPEDFERIAPDARRFVDRAHLGYVVIDRDRATPSLVQAAVRLFDLEKIDEAGSRELYRPKVSVSARWDSQIP